MLPFERKKWLEKQIILNDKVDINSVSSLLKVSPMTIRRDLNELEKKGRIIRTHGGAISSRSLTEDTLYSSKESENKKQKKSIAREASNLIKDKATIILDSGTTTLELAKCLKLRNDLTVVTNDIKIADELLNSDLKVIVTGGELQKGVGTLYGPGTEEMLNTIYADIFFLGAHAINLPDGVTSPTLERSMIKKKMMNAAKKTWLLADYSKFDKRLFSKVCSLNNIEGIITDNQITDEAKKNYGSILPIQMEGSIK